MNSCFITRTRPQTVAFPLKKNAFLYSTSGVGITESFSVSILLKKVGQEKKMKGIVVLGARLFRALGDRKFPSACVGIDITRFFLS